MNSCALEKVWNQGVCTNDTTYYAVDRIGFVDTFAWMHNLLQVTTVERKPPSLLIAMDWINDEEDDAGGENVLMQIANLI